MFVSSVTPIPPCSCTDSSPTCFAAAKHVGEESVQLHGGMGVTDETNIGHYFKRLTTIRAIFGNTDYHLKRYSAL